MSHMSELHIAIEERLAEGWTPSEIASNLQIPVEWVNNVLDGWYNVPTADQFADADAEAYGAW